MCARVRVPVCEPVRWVCVCLPRLLERPLPTAAHSLLSFPHSLSSPSPPLPFSLHILAPRTLSHSSSPFPFVLLPPLPTPAFPLVEWLPRSPLPWLLPCSLPPAALPSSPSRLLPPSWPRSSRPSSLPLWLLPCRLGSPSSRSLLPLLSRSVSVPSLPPLAVSLFLFHLLSLSPFLPPLSFLIPRPSPPLLPLSLRLSLLPVLLHRLHSPSGHPSSFSPPHPSWSHCLFLLVLSPFSPLSCFSSIFSGPSAPPTSLHLPQPGSPSPTVLLSVSSLSLPFLSPFVLSRPCCWTGPLVPSSSFLPYPFLSVFPLSFPLSPPLSLPFSL
ncbi:WAS/WASL-interacting protein family member 1-like [Dasypus novemcinctus]|uniref:WAS/WASL-interacting protein family member 1-like n=1 Tax=Dasypus novemcinctus TaxID=9361 RepID=UPI00265E47E7|nr:YLP motif-containing protein 1-like isoform X2 [Dasypus novemcinctus]